MISTLCRTAVVPCGNGDIEQTFLVDPDSRLDFGLDWTPWITGGDRIVEATWTISPHATLDGPDHDDTGAMVFVSGLTAGVEYRLRCRVRTTDGRQDARSVRLECRDR